MDHLQWLQNKTIEGIIHEKTVNLLTSNIFINKQSKKEIMLKIENSLKKNKSNKYFYGKDFNILKAENSFIQYEDKFGSIVLPEPNILGDHQLTNISTSITAARNLFNIKNAFIYILINSLMLCAHPFTSFILVGKSIYIFLDNKFKH